MDWSDDEFEAFLRQFRPRKPKALPTRRRTVVALATAAVIVAAVVIPMRYGSRSPAANDSTQTPASAPSPSTNVADGMSQDGRRDMRPAVTLDRVPDANTMPPGAEKSTAAVSRLPTLSPPRGVKQPGSPSSNGSVSATSGAAANQRLRVGGAIKPPRLLVRVNPIYPEEARAAGIAGVVVLDIVIGEDGSVIETRVLRSIPELDQAAIDAVSQWKYETTLLNGEPVELEATVTINFSLQ